MFLPTFLAPPRDPGAFIRLDLRDAIDVSEALGSLTCAYYVHSSLCSTLEGRPSCDQVEGRLGLHSVRHVVLPAVADHFTQGYEGEVVDVSISRVDAVRSPGPSSE
jgi:hypothetical protein